MNDEIEVWATGQPVTHVRKGGRGIVKAVIRPDDLTHRAAVVWDDRLPSWPALTDLKKLPA